MIFCHDLFVNIVAYNGRISPNNLQNDTDYLTNQFISEMLTALGIVDESGSLFASLEEQYFDEGEVGNWDLMIPGMTNVRFSTSQ